MKQKPTDLRPESNSPAPPGSGAPGYDEWLLDEAIEETFPASDPVSAARPGSSLAVRNHYHYKKRKI